MAKSPQGDSCGKLYTTSGRLQSRVCLWMTPSSLNSPVPYQGASIVRPIRIGRWVNRLNLAVRVIF